MPSSIPIGGLAETLDALGVFCLVAFLSLLATILSFVWYRWGKRELSELTPSQLQARRDVYVWSRRIGLLASVATFGWAILVFFSF